MVPLSKRWRLVAAVGYGVIFSQALVGAVRLGYWLTGATLSQATAGRLFFISSLLTGSLSAYLYARFSKAAANSATAPVAPADSQWVGRATDFDLVTRGPSANREPLIARAISSPSG